MRTFDDLEVGDSASLEREITAADVQQFVELTGDDNPVHIDDEYASSMGLSARVVHGMLSAGYVSTVIGKQLPGPGALWMSERFNFRAPVFIGDRIEVSVTIRRISPAARILVLDVEVRSSRGWVVLDGEANVQVLERADSVNGPSGGAQIAVVTGSGRGIGAAIAKHLARDGLKVVVNYRRDEAKASETLEAIRSDGGEASLFQADVSDPGQASALIAHATETFGAVDALVNNAGGGPNARALNETTWDDVEAHLSSHLRGSFLCAQAVLPGMVERGFGRIVNVTSQAAYGVPPAKNSGYVVAKAALAALTRSIAVEAGPSGVSVNSVAPGMTSTDMVADVSPRSKSVVASQTPLRRLPQVEDIAGAVAFLLGPNGAFVTGQTIHLSGGQVMS